MQYYMQDEGGGGVPRQVLSVASNIVVYYWSPLLFRCNFQTIITAYSLVVAPSIPFFF